MLHSKLLVLVALFVGACAQTESVLAGQVARSTNDDVLPHASRRDLATGNNRLIVTSVEFGTPSATLPSIPHIPPTSIVQPVQVSFPVSSPVSESTTEASSSLILHGATQSGAADTRSSGSTTLLIGVIIGCAVCGMVTSMILTLLCRRYHRSRRAVRVVLQPREAPSAASLDDAEFVKREV